MPQLREELRAFLAEHVLQVDDVMICRRCLVEIQMQTAYISIHAAEFEICAGAGQCEQLRIPYCATCEPVPADHGCIHVDYAIMRYEFVVAVWWSKLLGV